MGFSLESNDKTLLEAAIALIVMVAFAYWVFTNPEIVETLVTGYGLVGLLVASIIANASIFLPVPIDILVFAIDSDSSNLLNVVVVALVVGFGAALGEMTAYLMGVIGIKAAERAKHKEFKYVDEIRRRLKKSGLVFIILGAMTPFPFDIIGITAGLIKYDYKKFFIGAFIGKFLRYLLIGFAGYYGMPFLREFFL
jgi:membrane protein YqaA with SNARE-associated domain